jgi:uncharacterized membrane protein SpoIIM required for sporulation
LLFYGVAVTTALFVLSRPDSIYDLIPPFEVRMIEEMYNPSSEHYLKPRVASGDADMFGFYIYNNVSIAFRTFAGGAIAGIGSIVSLGFNALFFGAVAGDLIGKGFSNTFFTFIIAHSSFELTALIMVAYAGSVLGWSLFVTRGRSRASSLKAAGDKTLPLLAGSALFLVIAAVIEAFWSSRHELSSFLRFAVGTALWVAVAFYFVFGGRMNPSPRYRKPV